MTTTALAHCVVKMFTEACRHIVYILVVVRQVHRQKTKFVRPTQREEKYNWNTHWNIPHKSIPIGYINTARFYHRATDVTISGIFLVSENGNQFHISFYNFVIMVILKNNTCNTHIGKNSRLLESAEESVDYGGGGGGWCKYFVTISGGGGGRGKWWCKYFVTI